MKKVTLIGALAMVSLAGAAQAQIWASAAHNYLPGTQEDGSALPVDRTNTANALGVPQNDDSFPDTINFVSLGFGGQLTLSFGEQFKDTIYWYETTFGASFGHFEFADLYVGTGADALSATYHHVANLSNLVEGVPVSLATVQGNTGIFAWDFVKFVDTSSFIGLPYADGFDIDGVGADPIPAPGAAALLGVGGLLAARRRR
ncbi:MAG: hypothetical protein JNL50_05970 [Phycisphaerae bacterium]|nr:hypothetical protein [Phycisphaerae bacterium]